MSNVNDWKDEWEDMPEYNNLDKQSPWITATFKFRNDEDFNTFKALVKEHVYQGEKLFDGMQRRFVKQAWYPLNEKASKYVYEDKE